MFLDPGAADGGCVVESINSDRVGTMSGLFSDGGVRDHPEFPVLHQA